MNAPKSFLRAVSDGFLTVVAAGCLLGCGAAFAESPKERSVDELLAAYEQNPRDVHVALELGVRYHDAMRDAGKDAAYGKRRNRENLDLLYKKATKYLKRAQFMTQFGAVPNAYLGSLTVLRGRDVSYSDRGLLVRWRAPKNFTEGAEMIDQAIQQDPEDVTVRLVRVADVEHVDYLLTPETGPEMLQQRVLRRDRMVMAVKDIEFILEKCAKDPDLGRRLNTAQLHLRAGKLARTASEFDKARGHLGKAIQLGGDSEFADEAKDILGKLPGSKTPLEDGREGGGP
jgi:tetratricopeptide (TPR) repeat protein